VIVVERVFLLLMRSSIQIRLSVPYVIVLKGLQFGLMKKVRENMPIPKPTKKESKKQFLARGMGDSVMVSEYPDTKQRYAILLSEWKKRGK